MKKQKKWDIFCKIVDNFGDIGVCWRLANQLQQEYGLEVRLYVDHLSIAAKILTGIRNVPSQHYKGVEIVQWDEDTVFDVVADVVIETFACDLPAEYLTLMSKESVWVNVDHLSAESWVPEFHGLHGKHQSSKLQRHFYFPGFTEQTGGLLREQNLIKQRDEFQSSNTLQGEFWRGLAISASDNDLKVSLFSYNNAPVNAFLQALAEGNQPVSLYMPFNSCLPETLLDNTNLIAGDCVTIGSLTLYVLPFLSQDEYDKLLWSCDINFVRGEDSWVRAVWAAKPFIWQPYWQTDNAHLVKLNAFLATFYQSPAIGQILSKLHEAWSVESFHHESWQHYVANLSEISALTRKQTGCLSQQPSLVTKLVAFCANLAK